MAPTWRPFPSCPHLRFVFTIPTAPVSVRETFIILQSNGQQRETIRAYRPPARTSGSSRKAERSN